MRPLGVVETKISLQALFSLTDCLVLMKINFLVLDGPPQALYENVVINPTPAIPAYFYLRIFQKNGELLSGKLHSLVCVEDFCS